MIYLKELFCHFLKFIYLKIKQMAVNLAELTAILGLRPSTAPCAVLTIATF